MCGIAGIIGNYSLSNRAESAMGAMLRSLRHRGPDDEGLWQSPTGIARFAHARLSILDLSPAGHQPMSTADGRFTITFNGEIYNYKALRADLESEGVDFRTGTDTEVILHLYARQGAACVRKLRGMFAFAIWDEQERSCFLVRGPFGIKPLYYTATADGLAFASEVRSLLETGFAERTLDPAAVTAYFRTGSVPEPLTLLKGTSCLRAGYCLHWQDGRISQGYYWRPEFPLPDYPTSDPATFAREALLDSVRHHFVSDVPVGLFLSGGIDSTALVALSRAVGAGNLQTYSIGLQDRRLNESDLAKRTAAHFGTTHHELQLSSELGKDLFDRFLPCVDQPTIDGFNTYVVSWFAREKGAKVVLSGLGGDEVFGGYSSFQMVPRLYHTCRAIKSLPFAGKMLGSTLAHPIFAPRVRRLGSLLQGSISLRDVYRTYRGIYLQEEARALAIHFTGSTAVDASFSGDEPLATDLHDAVCELELTIYMRNQLLKDSDVMSMAHGLELRVPFVDAVLFDRLAHLPPSVRLRKGKQLLLDAVPEIPAWVRNQPKRGFLFPYAQWLEASPWKNTFQQTLHGLPVTATAWYQRWSVFVFKNWCQTHGISTEGK
jgi:asparagine synthase (glutamine-hydrolysing)